MNKENKDTPNFSLLGSSWVYKNNEYIITDLSLVKNQVTRKWDISFVYKPVINFDAYTYVRDVDEFKSKFKRVFR